MPNKRLAQPDLLLFELSVNKLNFLQCQGIHYVYDDFGCDRPLKEMDKVEIALNRGYRWAIQLAISIKGRGGGGGGLEQKPERNPFKMSKWSYI